MLKSFLFLMLVMFKIRICHLFVDFDSYGYEPRRCS